MTGRVQTVRQIVGPMPPKVVAEIDQTVLGSDRLELMIADLERWTRDLRTCHALVRRGLHVSGRLGSGGEAGVTGS